MWAHFVEKNGGWIGTQRGWLQVESLGAGVSLFLAQTAVSFGWWFSQLNSCLQYVYRDKGLQIVIAFVAWSERWKWGN